MPTYRFTDSEGRVYSNLSGGPLVVVPGESYDLDECPVDGRWEATDSPVTALDAPVEPAAPVDDPSTPETTETPVSA
jgi:hypothetical protein